MAQTLIIIGAGTAGLAAGCYAQMNGYQTTILEMAQTPGGLCTSWRRKGYLFDGSVAGLAGTSPGTSLYHLWQEIGIANVLPLYNGEHFGQIHIPDGRIVTIYTDIDRLEKHLISHFPLETRAIRSFTQAIRSVLGLEVPFYDAQGWQAVKQKAASACNALAHLPALIKYGNMTIRQFSRRFKDPALITAFNNIVHFGGPDVPLLTMLLPLAYAHRRMAGIPVHGWLSFARAIEKRFVDLGGQVKYAAKVNQLVFDAHQVKGVILADGTTLLADKVLSAADGRFSHSRLINRDEALVNHLFRPEDLSDQPVQVNLGVADDFSNENGAVTYIIPNLMQAAGRQHSKITVHSKFYDPDAAPAGKSALTVFLDSDYRWWQTIADDPKQYAQEKERCAQVIIDIIGRFRPGFADRVEVIDVSTPITRERYTGNWMGAMQARKPNSSMLKSLLQGGPRYADREINGFYHTGQWVEAWGGITTAAQSGRKAIQAICRDDKKRFQTTYG